MKFIFAVFISLVSTSTSILAWDGNRQGFLWGFGAGTNSQTILYTDVDYRGDVESEQLSTSITNFRIGYAPDNNSAVLLYGHSLWNLYQGGAQSYFGINFQRWSTDEPQSNSWFGGAGVMVRSSNVSRKEMDPPDPDVGWGANFGYGREIVNHASIESNLTIGGISIKGNTQILVGSNITFHLLGY